jgi:hypothetical protein
LACLPVSMFTRHPHESRGPERDASASPIRVCAGMTKPRLSLPIGNQQGSFSLLLRNRARSDRKSPAESSSCRAFPDRVGREKLFPAAGSGREVAGKCNSRAWMARARAKINTIMAKVISYSYGNFVDYEICGQQRTEEPDPKACCVRRPGRGDSEGLPMRVALHSADPGPRRGRTRPRQIRKRFPWLELIWGDGGYNAWQVELRWQRCRRCARRSSSAATT